MRKFLLALLLATSSAPAALATPDYDLKPAGPLKNPIVLVHGATTKGAKLQVGILSFGDYFRRIKELYETSGTPVYIVDMATDASIGERATVLKNFLETELKGRNVNLIAHSLGGLDARYAASVLKAKQVRSITTIGTPHLGTPLADWAYRQTKERTAWYWLFRLGGYDMAHRRFLVELTTNFMGGTFNPKVKDVPGVRYFSYRTAADFPRGMSYLLWFTARWLRGEGSPLLKEGDDGMVPLLSQGWGKVLGTERLDHLGQINHHALRRESQEEAAVNLYRAAYQNLRQEGL